MPSERKIRTRAAPGAICNACLSTAKLTGDHVQPRGCVKPVDSELRTVAGSFHPKAKPLLSQTGLKVETLCGPCNNGLLGTRYDPALIELTQAVRPLVGTQIALPDMMVVRAKPLAVAKAVVGHVLAGYVPEPDAVLPPAPLTDSLRRFFLDPVAPLPNDLEIYFWAYDSPEILVAFGCALVNFRTHVTRVGALWKGAPLAFWIGRRVRAALEGAEPLLTSENLTLDTERDVRLRRDVPVGWPDKTPGDWEALLFDDGATIQAVPRPAKTRPRRAGRG